MGGAAHSVRTNCIDGVPAADLAILDRQADRLAWRAVDSASEGPRPREKHTLTALSGGRLLLFGGAPQAEPHAFHK